MCRPDSAPRLACPLLAGLFVSILILSLVFASRLRPASRAPLLFRPDTNIQVLLDLKYNLSAEGISCITCSGEGFWYGLLWGLCRLWSLDLKDERCKIQAPRHCVTSGKSSKPQNFHISLNKYVLGASCAGAGETAVGETSFLNSPHSFRC